MEGQQATVLQLPADQTDNDGHDCTGDAATNRLPDNRTDIAVISAASRGGRQRIPKLLQVLVRQALQDAFVDTDLILPKAEASEPVYDIPCSHAAVGRELKSRFGDNPGNIFAKFVVRL